MKPVKLPVLTKINDTFSSNFDDIPVLEDPPNTNHLRNSQDEINQMLNYLKTEDDVKQMKYKSTFYRRKMTSPFHYEISTLKKKCVNPSDIIDEVKQKYDFHMKMKELDKRIDRDDSFNNILSRNNNSSNIKFHNKMYKSSRTPRENRMIKLKLGEFREIERNHPKLTFTNSTNNNTLLTSLDKGGNLTNMTKDKISPTPKMSKSYLNHTLKINEMSSLLSQKHKEDNILLNSLIETLSTTFPDKFDKIQHLLKYNSSLINSENKQIQMFLFVLEVLQESFGDILDTASRNENNEYSNLTTFNASNELNLKIISILDAVFVDFCRHISLNSVYRSDFLKKIWLKKMDYIENLMTDLRAKLDAETERANKMLEENRMLGEIISRMEKEKEDLNKNNLRLNKENQKWLEMVIEKDNKEKELKQMIEDLQKELEDKTFQHTNLIMKIKKEHSVNNGNSAGNNTNTNRSLNSSDNNLITIEVPFNLQGEAGRNGSRRGTLMRTNIGSNNNTSNLTPGESSINMDYNVLFKSRQSRNSVFNRGLKAKISEKGQFEKRKVNIVDNSILNLELKDEIINTILNNNNQFQKYINKGFSFKNVPTSEIGVQTDIQVNQLDALITSSVLQELKNQSYHILANIEALSNYLFQFDATDFEEEKYKLTSTEYSESKIVLSTIKESYSTFIENFTKMSEEVEIIFKDMDNLRIQLEEKTDNSENMHESYSQIFNLFLECIKDGSSEIIDYLNKYKDNNISSTNLKIPNTEINDLLNKILQRNKETVEKEEIAPIFKFIPKPEITKHFKKSSHFGSKTGNKMVDTEKKTQSHNTNFKEIYSEFKVNQSKIRGNFTMKKVIKIINQIYFDMLEKIYFKKEKHCFDNNDDFIEFPEIMHIYFSQNFGLESLKKSKFLEFLSAIMNYETASKRVAIFARLILIHKYTGISIGAGIQNKQNNTSHNLPHVNNHSNSNQHPSSASLNNKSDFDTFVSRQLLLLIQILKNNNIILKSSDENSISIYLIQHKLSEIIFNNLLAKFAVSNQIKNKISVFIEKNKKNFSKNMKVYVVVDFDDLIDLMADVLTEIKNLHSQTLRKIYKAVGMSNSEGINFFEFLLLAEYIFSQRLTYDQAELLFNKFSDSEFMLYDHFETITIEGDLIDDKQFHDYLKINEPDHLVALFKTLQEELKSSALTIFDDMGRRLVVINKNLKYKEIVSQLNEIKYKITEGDLSQYTNIQILWISIKIFDNLSLDIYNNCQLHKIFKDLDFIYNSLEDISGEKKPENLIIRFLRMKGRGSSKDILTI